MTQTKPVALLLADDVAMDDNSDKRSGAVKDCANRLAQALQASIDVIHVEDLYPYPVKSSQFRALISQFYKDQKSKLSALASSLQVPTRVFFVRGEPAKKILARSSKPGAYEMIVLGTRGRNGLSRLFLGSVSEEVIRQARIPVLTVGPGAQEAGRAFLPEKNRKILIATSLTPNSAKAEEFGIRLAKRLNAEVVFFHSLHEALHPVLQTAFSAPVPPPAIIEFLEEVKASANQELAEKARKAAEAGVAASHALDPKTLSSDVAILKEAERISACLIITGTHGRSMFSTAFFGRTARDVIAGASVPVITVHSRKS